jgi:amino acid adenylation domain-containing protein
MLELMLRILPSDITTTQAAIWLDQQLFPGKPIYNTGQVLTIRGELRVDIFERALHEVIAESLCLQLPPRSSPAPFNLTLLDFRDEKDPTAAAMRWMQSAMGAAISLDDPALFHFALIQVGVDQSLWFQKYHHIIIDATGRQLLSQRTASRYRALRFGDPLPKIDAVLPDQLVDEERRYLSSHAHEADRCYWLREFDQWPGPLHEIDRQHTERAKSGRHARITFTLKRADFARLGAAAHQLGSSPFRAIVALTFAAFARLYERSDIVLGLELANRSGARAKQTIGFLARPLPMLFNFEFGATLADVLRYTDDTRLRNYPHRQFPVQELARELSITRKGHHGLFDVIVNYIPASYDFTFEDFPVEVTNLSYGFTTPWAITIADTGSTRDLEVTVDTDPGLIPSEMAARLATMMEILLLRSMEQPSCSIASLPIVPEKTQEQMLAFGTGTTVAFPEKETLATLFASQAERSPDAIAVVCGEQQLSFRHLHEKVRGLAQKLVSVGVKPGGIVGIALPRTPSMVIAVLAVHRAGAAYLALDPKYPAERINFMVADAAAPVILTDASTAPIFAGTDARLLLETEFEAIEAGAIDFTPGIPSDLAYVLYTSGSTGSPKAVGIDHRNLINLISWGRSVITDEELHGVLFSTSLNFDLSAFEMFLPLAFGGCIVLVENLLTLRSACQREKVRLINTGPSLFDALLRTGDIPAAVTTVILAGEILSRHLASSVFDSLPNVRLLNCYGPTETTVYSSCAVVEADVRSEPTIGGPIWNTTLHVLDNAKALVPSGVEGELYIGGAGVARGYLGRPELTAERFLANRYGPGHLYRTGDRARWRSDGELEFLGRADDQIKINGIRIEPGEIEAALVAIPTITAAMVTPYEDVAGTRRLVAYVVSSSEAKKSEEELRTALERKLPRNMVPALFIWLDAIPVTPNGKRDRKALPRPPRIEVQSPLDRPPQAGLEREIADIWEDLLQLSPIGARSDFFDVGGDSLALIGLFATIEARYGRHLTVDVLSGGLTIAGLAETLSEESPFAGKIDPVVALQPRGHLPPFFCVHGIGGDAVHLHRLAVHMGTNRPFFGLRRATDARHTDTITQIAERYVAAMLVRQTKGPFFLGGHSFGAAVAYEMALQLTELGHEVGLLAIIDQRRPGWRLTARSALPVLHRILARLPARIREDFLDLPERTSRLRHIQRTIVRWSKAAVGRPAKINSMFDLTQSRPEQVLVLEGHLRALQDYRPRPSAIPVTLFRAEVQLLSNLALDWTLGWRALTDKKVRVRVVPGNHGSITGDPFVADLARMLCEELDSKSANRVHFRLQ